MKVFLDTNVLASAVATRGLCADVLQVVLASHEWVTSEQVLEELDRFLRTKLRYPAPARKDLCAWVRQSAIVAPIGKPPDVTLADRADLGILAAALASGSDVLVTGDRELLGLGAVRGLPVLSPRAFWERIQSGRRGRSR